MKYGLLEVNDMENIKQAIEGIIFLSGDEGIALSQLSTCFEDSDDNVIEKILDELMVEYVESERGMEIVHFGGLYKFVSKACIHPYAEQLFAMTKMSSLSQAALETLAIIAYKQPITRVEIEEIRGVGCDMMIRKLLARSLIKECGRSEAVGRPFLNEITEEFMDAFKLQSLKELPELANYRDNDNEELFDNE